MYRTARGFTLIELMIVVAIIAILSTIGLTVYSGIQRGARDSKRQTDIQELQKALEQYYAINRTFPPNLSTLGATYFSSGAIPSDPLSSSAPYAYTHCSTNERYALCTGAGAMETCNGTTRPNCNATAAGNGCGPFTAGTTATNTLFCVGSLSN